MEQLTADNEVYCTHDHYSNIWELKQKRCGTLGRCHYHPYRSQMVYLPSQFEEVKGSIQPQPTTTPHPLTASQQHTVLVSSSRSVRPEKDLKGHQLQHSTHRIAYIALTIFLSHIYTLTCKHRHIGRYTNTNTHKTHALICTYPHTRTNT